MGRKSALRREIAWILRGSTQGRSKLQLICGLFLKGRVLAQDGWRRSRRAAKLALFCRGRRLESRRKPVIGSENLWALTARSSSARARLSQFLRILKGRGRSRRAPHGSHARCRTPSDRTGDMFSLLEANIRAIVIFAVEDDADSEFRKIPRELRGPERFERHRIDRLRRGLSVVRPFLTALISQIYCPLGLSCCELKEQARFFILRSSQQVSTARMLGIGYSGTKPRKARRCGLQPYC